MCQTQRENNGYDFRLWIQNKSLTLFENHTSQFLYFCVENTECLITLYIPPLVIPTLRAKYIMQIERGKMNHFDMLDFITF